MSLVKTSSTKQEGESHSSLFYGLVENEKINKSHVTRHHNKQHCQEERRKQTRVCEFGGFIFDLTYYHSLKNM
jgi:hypothetical protein